MNQNAFLGSYAQEISLYVISLQKVCHHNQAALTLTQNSTAEWATVLNKQKTLDFMSIALFNFSKLLHITEYNAND